MSNEFRGTGNVADAPVVKTVMVGDDERKVTDLRVFFDEYRPDGRGGFEQKGGFWLDVNVWGERRATEAAQHIKRGARVHVVGRLVESRWTTNEGGEERRALYVDADELYLSLSRVAAVTLKPRREVQGSAA